MLKTAKFCVFDHGSISLSISAPDPQHHLSQAIFHPAKDLPSRFVLISLHVYNRLLRGFPSIEFILSVEWPLNSSYKQQNFPRIQDISGLKKSAFGDIN